MYQKPKVNHYWRIFLLGTSLSAFALPEDKQQPVVLNADVVSFNQQQHLGTYQGHIRLDQGSTHLRANQATTKFNHKTELLLAKAWGDSNHPAHFWILPEKNKPELHAYAETLSYYPKQQRIKLVGHARISQGKNSFKAPEIQYNLARQQVLTTPKHHQRTTIIFHHQPK